MKTSALGIHVVACLALASAAATANPPRPRPEVVTCDRAPSAEPAAPLEGDRLLLGRVAIAPRSRVIQLRNGFAKSPPLFAAGGPVTLEVPPAYRRVYSLDFMGSRGARLRFRPCPSPPYEHWTWWSGGYRLRRPACVPLVVRADGRSAHVWLSIGQPCPALTRASP